MSYTEKERRESAECIIKMNSQEYSREFMEKVSKEHFTKFTPPDPDRELRERFEMLAYDCTGSRNGIHNLYNVACDTNLLATEARLNEVRVELLDELITLGKSISGVTEFKLKGLRTRYTKGVE